MWNPDPFVANRPVKVVPVGHKKPKFFAQMSASHNERPHLDFNKMQHSRRLILVRFASLCVGWLWWAQGRLVEMVVAYRQLVFNCKYLL